MKVLHTADIHLDTPFSLLDPEKADLRRSELRATFASLVLYAKTQKVDLFLISGDLFNNTFASRETLAFLRREFESAPDCRFVIAPGNHDCYTEFSVYAKTEFPENVYIFREPHLTCFTFDDLSVNVWGFAWCDDKYTEHALNGFSLPKTKSMNILCAHADTTGGPQSVYAPISREELENSGFDYAALGHIHNSDGIRRARDTYYGYSGCLEGRGFDETGFKGALFAEMTKEDGVLSFSAKRLRFSKRRYECDTLDIGGAVNMADVLSRVKVFLTEQKYDANTALSLTLTGEVSPQLSIDTSFLREKLTNLMRLEIRDETKLQQDRTALLHDPTIRGAFYTALRPLLESDNPDTVCTAEAALRLGLDAMENSSSK